MSFYAWHHPDSPNTALPLLQSGTLGSKFWPLSTLRTKFSPEKPVWWRASWRMSWLQLQLIWSSMGVRMAIIPGIGNSPFWIADAEWWILSFFRRLSPPPRFRKALKFWMYLFLGFFFKKKKRNTDHQKVQKKRSDIATTFHSQS